MWREYFRLTLFDVISILAGREGLLQVFFNGFGEVSILKPE
jgi:hypothetical protein